MPPPRPAASVVRPVVLDLVAAELQADVDHVVAAVLSGRQGNDLADLLQAGHPGAVAGKGNGDVETLARQHGLVGPRDGDEVADAGQAVAVGRPARGDDLSLPVDVADVPVVLAAHPPRADGRLETHGGEGPPP